MSVKYDVLWKSYWKAALTPIFLTWDDIPETYGGHGDEAKVKSVHEPPSLPEGQHPWAEAVVQGEENDGRRSSDGVIADEVWSLAYFFPTCIIS